MKEATYFTGAPIKASLKADTKYAYCSCGHSQKFPYCDGYHRGTSYKPVKFFLPSDAEVLLCGCGKSHKKPYCDGSHSQ